MALVSKVADRVKETSTTTGTGTLDLAGAATGYRTFVAGIGTGKTTYYCITMGADWEVGVGTVTDASPDTLSRDTILASSNGGAAVNWGAGSKEVFCVAPAEWLQKIRRLSAQQQTSGASLSYVVPAGSLSNVGDELRIWGVANNGTSGSITMTINFGGTALAAISGGANAKIIWEVHVMRVTSTTVHWSWSWEADTGANDADRGLGTTVGDMDSDQTFSMVMTGGTSPDMEIMTVDLWKAP